jgi:spermidine synthase
MVLKTGQEKEMKQQHATPAQQIPGGLRFLLLFAAVLVFFFISGACGLVYQVVWTRRLVLLFGVTAPAVSTVLFIFFLGLGAGSLWGGRMADNSRRPLLIYGLLEILIGAWAVLFIFSVRSGEELVVTALRSWAASHAAGILLRGLMALALLFVPVTMMGATLPLLARFVNRSDQIQGSRIGALYSMNTFGAVAGCFTAGFLFIPVLGYARATFLGATFNVLVGLLAVLLSLRVEGRPQLSATPPAAPPAREAPPEDGITAAAALLTLCAFTLSGFSALALEVLWTRLLAIVFLGTTYAYTVMLSTLLCGIALGSSFAALFVDRIRGRMAVLGGILMLYGASCLLMTGWIAEMPEQIARLHQESGNDWNRVISGKVLLSFCALIIPTFLSGMTFPFVVRIITSRWRTLGRDVGRLYCANTFGGMIGALAGGFLILPVLGAHKGIVFLGALLALTGLLLLLAAPRTGRKGKAVIAAAGILLFLFAWHRAPADVSRSLNAGYIPDNHRILHYNEGVEGTVVVSEPADEESGTNRVLWINRVQATASIEKGVRMNRLQGVLPLLFNRAPRDVLFMCFGSGITCGTLAIGGFDNIDAVEISESVLEAAPLFDADNLGVLERPNVTFHVDDGRNFMLTAEKGWDLITFEPMPLALAGVSTFYTAEYYDLCLRRLNDWGMVSQWIPLHSLNPELVRSLAKTFTAVFPHYCAWFVNADMFLIGSNAPLMIDAKRLASHLEKPELRRALEAAGFHDIPEIIACFLMDKDGMDAWCADGVIMTDDRPWAEFEAPRLVYERTVPDSLATLMPHLSSPTGMMIRAGLDGDLIKATARRHEARKNDLAALQAYYGGMVIDPGVAEGFRESLRIDPEGYNAKYYLRQIMAAQFELKMRWGEYDRLIRELEKTLAVMPGDTGLLLRLCDAAAAQGDRDRAREWYKAYRQAGGAESRELE